MRNEYEIRGDVTAIFLKRKTGEILETLINTVDLPKLLEYPTTWFANWDPKGQRFYAQANSKTVNGKRKGIKLHRFIMDAPPNLHVDHINHNTLDNRCSVNLRLVTRNINMQNRDGLDKSNTSGARGVYWSNSKNAWITQVTAYGKHYYGQSKDFQTAVKKAEHLRRKLHATNSCGTGL